MNFPKFNLDEINYIYDCVCESETEITENKQLKGVFDFTPFKNKVVNKINKYNMCLKQNKRDQPNNKNGA